jgi:hypothetical protein
VPCRQSSWQFFIIGQSPHKYNKEVHTEEKHRRSALHGCWGTSQWRCFPRALLCELSQQELAVSARLVRSQMTRYTMHMQSPWRTPGTCWGTSLQREVHAMLRINAHNLGTQDYRVCYRFNEINVKTHKIKWTNWHTHGIYLTKLKTCSHKNLHTRAPKNKILEKCKTCAAMVWH